MKAQRKQLTHFPILFLLTVLIICNFLTPAAGTPPRSPHPPQEEAPADSLEFRRRPRADSNFIYEYIAHPFLRIVTWPIEKFIVPVVETAFIPARPPLEYIFEEQLLDRAIDLISFGPDNQIYFYPVAVISTGTGSLSGFTFRHRRPFGRNTERLVSSLYFFVNGDWKLRTRLYLNQAAGSRFNIRLRFMQDDLKDATFPPPRTDSLRYYSNKSIGGDITVSHPLLETLWLSGMLIYRNRKIGPPPKGLTPIQCGMDGPFLASPNCLEERLINKQFEEKNIRIGLIKKTIDNDNIPTRGSKIDAWWEYHFISDKHSYHDWEVTFQKFFFLGIEQYEITPQEQREMGNLNFDKIKKTLKVKNLKKRIFKRKVIVTQLQLAQAYEVYKGRGPLFVLHTLSNGTPMRGYTASPFHDFSIIAVSAEYRFPIMRLVEGTIFNEYGWVGKQFNSFSTDRLRNSWGIGIRMARRDLFLFRAQVGFHGLSTPVINITVDTTY